MHVHIYCADGEAKFWLEPEIELARNHRLSRKQLKKIERTIEEKTTSALEVTNVSDHGLWLLTEERELFLAYDEFPWFKDAPVRDIFNVEQPSPGHFYWPDLDVDLGLDSIENPDRFPLKAKH